MTDDGLTGDQTPGDSVYSTMLPAQAYGRMIGFWVEAVDGAGASARFPAVAPSTRCLYRVGETNPASALDRYHVWMAPETVTALANAPKMSNELFDALPFHVVAGGPPQREVYVAESWPDGPFVEVLGDLSDDRLDLRRRHEEPVELPAGTRAEVSLKLDALAVEVARALRVGAVLAVDYGDAAPQLYDVRKRNPATIKNRPRGIIIRPPRAQPGEDLAP